MKHRHAWLSLVLACVAVLTAGRAGAAAAKPSEPSGHPTSAEKSFVAEVTAKLRARFPTVAEAEAAGYVRYTNEDETGAISYANKRWASADADHPSQLWYDANGKLLGADYSVLHARNPRAPQRFGVDSRRWLDFSTAHYHFALRAVGSEPIYGALEETRRGLVSEIERVPGKPVAAKVPTSKLARVRADLARSSPRAIVDAGLAPSLGDVAFFFKFPALWDLMVWVAPNPSGAFAEKNPSVKPVHPPAKMSGM